MKFACTRCGSRYWPDPDSSCPLCRDDREEPTEAIGDPLEAQEQATERFTSDGCRYESATLWWRQIDEQTDEKLNPETMRAARAVQDEARAAGKKVPTLTQAAKMLERTTGTATLESARLNALAKRSAARIDAMNALTMNPKYNEAVKKGDADTVRRLEREARAKVDVQFAEFLEPGVEPEAAPAAAPARAKPTLKDFLAAAKKANPGVSDEALTNYYNQKYGK